MIGITRDRLWRVCLQICFVAGVMLAGAGPEQAFAFNADPQWASDRSANQALALEHVRDRARRTIWLTGANPPGPHRPVIVTGSLGDAARIGGIAITPTSPTWKMQGLKPQLVMLLTRVQQHYGRPLQIVSGCRSKAHNTKVRGAKRSQHLECSAVDFEISDVSKHQLAAYLKQMPGRGGVGLYCRSSYVHLDIGPKRDWHWRCKERKVAKKRKARRKHASVKKAGVKRASAKKASAKKASGKKTRAKKAPVKTASLKQTGLKRARLRHTGAKEEAGQRRAFKKSSTARRALVIKKDR